MTEVVNVKTLFCLGQSAPKMDAFSTDVLNVTLFFLLKHNAPPKWMQFMTEILNVNFALLKHFFVATKCFQIL